MPAARWRLMLLGPPVPYEGLTIVHTERREYLASVHSAV